MRVSPTMGWRDPLLPCHRKMRQKQVEKVKRGSGGGNFFAGATAALPPPQSQIGVKRGEKEKEKGVQQGQGLVKPPELIKSHHCGSLIRS